MLDCDGVIVDSLDDQCQACIATLQAQGLAEFATREQFLAFTDSNWYEALSTAGVPDEVVEALDEAFAATPRPDLFPQMAEVIECLAEDNQVVVITSSNTSVVERVLEEHGVRGVTEVVGGDQEESKTRKIASARRRYGGSLPAWYVGDTVGDILEARAAGVGTIGAAWGWHGEERLRSARPDVIARRPRDLLDLF
jgi:phosphoglycolate phosphatase